MWRSSLNCLSVLLRTVTWGSLMPQPPLCFALLRFASLCFASLCFALLCFALLCIDSIRCLVLRILNVSSSCISSASPQLAESSFNALKRALPFNLSFRTSQLRCHAIPGQRPASRFCRFALRFVLFFCLCPNNLLFLNTCQLRTRLKQPLARPLRFSLSQTADFDLGQSRSTNGAAACR